MERVYNRSMAKRKLTKKTPEQVALNEAIRAAGGIVKAAALFHVTLAAIGGWRRRGLPAKRVREIEDKTGVNRKRLRPDLYA